MASELHSLSQVWVQGNICKFVLENECGLSCYKYILLPVAFETPVTIAV